MKKTIAPILIALVIATASCGGDTPPADDAAQTADSAHAGMPGMSMTAPDSANAAMRQHLTMMQGVSGDSLRVMLPGHRQMAGNMLARMNQEMTSMNMTADAAWSAVTDSIRADLTRMPELSAAELQTLMPEHHRRMTRLMEMHDAMMKTMRM